MLDVCRWQFPIVCLCLCPHSPQRVTNFRFPAATKIKTNKRTRFPDFYSSAERVPHRIRFIGERGCLYVFTNDDIFAPFTITNSATRPPSSPPLHHWTLGSSNREPGVWRPLPHHSANSTQCHR